MVAVFEAAGMLGNGRDLALCGGVESMSRVHIGLSQGLSDFIRRFSQSRTAGEKIDRLGELRWKDVKLLLTPPPPPAPSAPPAPPAAPKPAAPTPKAPSRRTKPAAKG